MNSLATDSQEAFTNQSLISEKCRSYVVGATFKIRRLDSGFTNDTTPTSRELDQQDDSTTAKETVFFPPSWQETDYMSLPYISYK
jgi:hypothetical protein